MLATVDDTPWCLPDTAQADKSSPRTWSTTFMMDLIEYSPLLNEILVASEGYDGRRVRWSVLSFCRPAVSADHLKSLATHQEQSGSR